jgi:hypothetical protein
MLPEFLMQRSLAIAVLGLMLAGCGAAPDNTMHRRGGQSSISVTAGGAIAPQPKPDPDAPRKVLNLIIVLDVYHFKAPLGAISGNTEFWKHVDEDTLDVAVHDLLLKNGLRTGVAHDEDWTYFKGLLAKYPSIRSTPLRSSPGKEGYVELPMRTDVTEQTIFGIDDHGVDWGRRFEDCDDILTISYMPATHNPEQTIVKLCPLVRGKRQSLSVSVLNNDDIKVERKFPQHLYDLRMEASIPVNSFLIVAPSPDASTLSTSLGSTFLVTEGEIEPIENVLMLVPRAFQIEENAPLPPAAK